MYMCTVCYGVHSVSAQVGVHVYSLNVLMTNLFPFHKYDVYSVREFAPFSYL